MEPRRTVTRRTVKRAAFTVLALGMGVAAWQAVSALQNDTEPTEETQDVPVAKPAAPKPSSPALPSSRFATPMAQRIATIGLLNKRNGLWRDLKMKPGEAVRIGDIVVRLRACETTAPWENETYTGAFVQVITRATGKTWVKTFSGWLYKESPSLNVVEHPIYDVWVKACEMRHPDIGDDTIIARGDEGSDGPSSRSRARKSDVASPDAPTVDTAAESSEE